MFSSAFFRSAAFWSSRQPIGSVSISNVLLTAAMLPLRSFYLCPSRAWQVGQIFTRLDATGLLQLLHSKAVAMWLPPISMPMATIGPKTQPMTGRSTNSTVPTSRPIPCIRQPVPEKAPRTLIVPVVGSLPCSWICICPLTNLCVVDLAVIDCLRSHLVTAVSARPRIESQCCPRVPASTSTR